MKKIIYLFVFCVIALHSCIDDEGNYVYQDLVRLDVDSVKTSYSVRSMVDHLVIKPEITSSGDYNCIWMLYTGQVNPVIDTISTEKELDYPVTEPAGSYRLVLEVADNQTGDATYVTSNVNISTLYSTSWYVLKEIDGATDVDLIASEEETMQDLFLNLHGERMEGLPIDISYTPSYRYIDKDNVLYRDKAVLWVCSEDNIYMLETANLNIVREHDELFYGPVPNEMPYHVGFTMGFAIYMSSAGVYYQPGMTMSSGKFGSPVMLENDDYQLGRLSCTFDRSFIFWDELNSRFIAMNNGTLRTFQDKDKKGDTPEIVPNNMNCDLLMLDRTTNAGYAVLKKRTSGELLVLELDKLAHDDWSPTFYNPINNLNAIRLSADHEMGRAIVFAQNHNLAYIYYTDGEKVNLFDFMTNSTREDLLPVNAGERITFMKHLYWTGDATNDGFEYLVVGTEHGEEYTLYFYELLGGVPDLDKEVISISGTGKIKDVQYVNSFVAFQQYPID